MSVFGKLNSKSSSLNYRVLGVGTDLVHHRRSQEMAGSNFAKLGKCDSAASNVDALGQRREVQLSFTASRWDIVVVAK